MKTICSDKASMAVSPNRGKIDEEQWTQHLYGAQKRDANTASASSPEFMETRG